jgi:hypothetical protein
MIPPWDVRESLSRYVKQRAEPDYMLAPILFNELLAGLETAVRLEVPALLDVVRYVFRVAREERTDTSPYAEWYGSRMAVAKWVKESAETNLKRYVNEHRAPGWYVYQTLIGTHNEPEMIAHVQENVPSEAMGSREAVEAWMHRW